MGALDVIYLKLPRVTPEFLGKVIGPFVEDISDDEWMSLDASDPASKAFTVLSDMCCAVVAEISFFILQDVEPQVLASSHHHARGNNVTVPGRWSSYRVTEMDTRACCRNSVYDCFGKVLDVAQESSRTLDQLVRLFSAEITKRVNSSLAQITGLALSSDFYYWPTSECIFQMVSTMGNIFKCMLEGRRRVKGESCDELPCLGCDCKQCCCFDSEGFEKRLAELLACVDNVNPEPAPQMKDESRDKLPCPDCKSKECWCFDFEGLEKRFAKSSACTDSLNPEPAPQVSDGSESEDISSSHSMDRSSRSGSPDFQINRTFLTVLLGKLVDHIAVKTKTSILNVNLEQLVYGVTVRTEGVLNFASPKNVAKLHISMYKELCLKFQSKYVLQAVMESGDDAFEFAVSETLKSQLMKQKTFKKRWKPFKPRNLPPVPEVQTPEAQSEESSEESSEETSFSPSKRSLGRSVRKKLSRWGSNIVDLFNRGLDSEIHRLDVTVTSPVWTNPLL